jgi:hypothetical protein
MRRLLIERRILLWLIWILWGFIMLMHPDWFTIVCGLTILALSGSPLYVRRG